VETKPGIKTSEFWITAIVNIVTAILAILAVRGMVTDQEAELWVQLSRALVAAAAPVVIAYTTGQYAASRAEVKAIAANYSLTASGVVVEPPKPGVQTTEFWITAIVDIVVAIIAILVTNGAISGEEGELWVQLVQAVVPPIAALVIAYTTGKYIQSRATVKTLEG